LEKHETLCLDAYPTKIMLPQKQRHFEETGQAKRE